MRNLNVASTMVTITKTEMLKVTVLVCASINLWINFVLQINIKKFSTHQYNGIWKFFFNRAQKIFKNRYIKTNYF